MECVCQDHLENRLCEKYNRYRRKTVSAGMQYDATNLLKPSGEEKTTQ